MHPLLKKRIEIPWVTKLYSILIHPSNFVRRPWSINKAFCLSVVCGAMLPPIINSFVLNCLPRSDFLPWRFAPLVFCSALAILLGILYWAVERVQFRTDRGAVWVTLLAGIIWALGATGSVWCFNHHVCMGGHMQHPPYPFWHYGLDSGWALCLVVAAVWMKLVRNPLCLTLAIMTWFLLSYRFLCGSFGGSYDWPL